MKSQNKIFIFRALNQICGLSQSQSISDIVLKEIESPDGIRWYADFGKSNLAYYFHSVRAFCLNLWAKYTSTQKVVGTGKIFCQQELKVTFTTSDLKPRQYTFSETTHVQRVLNCGLLSPFINSRRGKIEGGSKLHYLNSPLAHSAGFTYLNSLI